MAHYQQFLQRGYVGVLPTQIVEVYDPRPNLPRRMTSMVIPARVDYEFPPHTVIWPDEVDAASLVGRRIDAAFGPFKREYPTSLLYYRGRGIQNNTNVSNSRQTHAGVYRTQFIVDEITYVYIKVFPNSPTGEERTRVTKTETKYLVKYEGFDLDFGKWDSPDDSPENFLKNCVAQGDWTASENINSPGIITAWEYMKTARVFPWMRGVGGASQTCPMRIFLKDEEDDVITISDSDSA